MISLRRKYFMTEKRSIFRMRICCMIVCCMLGCLVAGNAYMLLGCLVAGISLHSGEHHAHSTRSGKQSEIVWSSQPGSCSRGEVYVYGVVMWRWGEGGDQCCIDSVLKTPECVLLCLFVCLFVCLFG